MNRPRNRQPRQNQQQNSQGQNHNRRPQSKPTVDVPNISQVLPGASVSIVLKADQQSGKETQGVVQDILTRGNHPRGIKVRLQTGAIGRVQRMAGSGEARGSDGERWPASVPTSPVMGVEQRGWQGSSGGRYAREDGDLTPARSLADFIAGRPDEPSTKGNAPERVTFASATATCPICGLFEGDEAAVSHHVQSHLD